MPIDPFLFFHKVGPYHINIGGQWSPLSIRDQMHRGRWAVERALDAGILSGDRPLAVVGAGAGGVSAAMMAVSQRVPTTLFDRESEPFSRHQTCWRWVDPTQYDWPLDHYPRGSIPWPAPTFPPPLPPVPVPPPQPPVPLGWPRANRAITLVGDWRAQFHTFRLLPIATAFLAWRKDAQVLNIGANPAMPMVDVTWRPVGLPGAPTVDSFGLVITAMGFGEERSFLAPSHPFRGYPFWSHDPFENPFLRWPPFTEGRPRVLISGAGDGALQDFLRITTRFKSARDLWDHLALTAPQRAAIQKAAQDIDDQANRAQTWSSGSRHDHEVLHRLSVGFQELAARIHAIPGIPASLSTAVRVEFSTLWFVHVCNHFNPGYALNRLLVLLLMEHLKSVGAPFVDMRGYRLVDVQCRHPAPPAPDPGACHWQTHLASFWPQPDCRTASPPPPPPITTRHPDQIDEEFDVLVLRHGIQPPPLLWAPGSTVLVPPTRQLLPYHHQG
jgi:hypothetical protein